MRLGVIAFLGVMSLGSSATLAQSTPIDLRTFSAWLAKQHLRDKYILHKSEYLIRADGRVGLALLCPAEFAANNVTRGPPLPTILAWATSAAFSNGTTNDARSLRRLASFSFEPSLIVPNCVVISHLPRAASPPASISSR